MELAGIIRNIIAVGIGAFIGVAIAYFFLPHAEDHLDEKGADKRKIIELFAAKNNISNEDVEKYLDVPSATAMRYLNELEKRGVVRRVKSTGRVVYYERITKNNSSAKKHA